ncbi:MAG TPA: GNAT family N-acetyltransferase [Stellaceae bacterium]
MADTLTCDLTETSESLVLKALRPEDAEAVRAITDHPAITTVIAILRPPFTVEDARALIRQNDSGQALFLGMWRRSDNALVGISCVFLEGDDEARLAQWVGTAFHSNGYGTEAAAALGRMVARSFPGRRIVAECNPENRASWKALEKAGYRSTGAPGRRPGRILMLYEGPIPAPALVPAD